MLFDTYAKTAKTTIITLGSLINVSFVWAILSVSDANCEQLMEEPAWNLLLQILKFYLSLLAGNPLKTSHDLAHTLYNTTVDFFGENSTRIQNFGYLYFFERWKIQWILYSKSPSIELNRTTVIVLFFLSITKTDLPRTTNYRSV